MEPSHIHLLLNHIPIIGAFFSLSILIIGLTRKNKILEKTGLMTIIIVALLTIPTFLSGDAAEESVENLEDVSEFYIEQHEESAELATWLMMATGVLALVTILFFDKKRKGIHSFKILTLIFLIVTFVAMVLTGNRGGKIRHSQLRNTSIDMVPQDMENHHDDDRE